MDERKIVTKVMISEEGCPVLVDWNGRAIQAGNTVLHTAAQGFLTISKVLKIYQKPGVRSLWVYLAESPANSGYVKEPVTDTLVRLEPIKGHPLNGNKATAFTINSRVNYPTFNSLTRFEVE